MNKLVAISAVAFLAASSAAFAADPIRPTPIVPVAPVIDSSSIWDGFYAGVNAGYGWGRGTIDIPPALFSGSGDVSGWLGGAQAGYNFASGGVVFGVETDIQLANIKYTETIPGVVTGEIGVESFGTLRGRIGVDAGSFMPYVTAGLAYGNLGYKFTPVGGGASLTNSNWAWGWAAGAGAEAMITDNVSFKGEYLYVDLGSTRLDLLGVPLDVKGHAHTVRAGLNFHF